MVQRTPTRKSVNRTRRKTSSATHKATRGTRRTTHSTRRGTNALGRAIEHRVKETEGVLRDVGRNLGSGTRRKSTRRRK